MIKNIGIKPPSKNKQKITKSKEQKTPIIRVSINKIAIKNSLSLFFIDELTDKIQSGVMKVVKMINNIEIPSTPTL